ncbi:uncharacterized protein AKAME5_001352700 [Lates japonicus]|uniref:Uncharacterized protein n=1 Tax=Lates japonicus TaxID=270547 RepID=A0AAD3MY18_LATJO|nr:uncharacterized protein AKAME5_001352700 [Lates japonicus]
MCIVCHNYYMRSTLNSLLNSALWDFCHHLLLLAACGVSRAHQELAAGEFSCRIIPHLEVRGGEKGGGGLCVYQTSLTPVPLPLYGHVEHNSFQPVLWVAPRVTHLHASACARPLPSRHQRADVPDDRWSAAHCQAVIWVGARCLRCPSC